MVIRNKLHTCKVFQIRKKFPSRQKLNVPLTQKSNLCAIELFGPLSALWELASLIRLYAGGDIHHLCSILLCIDFPYALKCHDLQRLIFFRDNFFIKVACLKTGHRSEMISPCGEQIFFSKLSALFFSIYACFTTYRETLWHLMPQMYRIWSRNMSVISCEHSHSDFSFEYLLVRSNVFFVCPCTSSAKIWGFKRKKVFLSHSDN